MSGAPAQLDGSACPACSRVALPAEQPCLACLAATRPTVLGPAGHILACTRTNARPDKDHWVLLVGLEGGARVLAGLDMASGDVPAVGDPVVVLREKDHGDGPAGVRYVARPRR